MIRRLIHKTWFSLSIQFSIPPTHEWNRKIENFSVCSFSFWVRNPDDDVVVGKGFLSSLTCLINGSRVRSIDLVFTSCNSFDGFLSRKPAIAKHWDFFVTFFNFSTSKLAKNLSYFFTAINSRKYFPIAKSVLTARKTQAKWTRDERNSFLGKSFELQLCFPQTIKRMRKEHFPCVWRSMFEEKTTTTRDFGIIANILSESAIAIGIVKR